MPSNSADATNVGQFILTALGLLFLVTQWLIRKGSVGLKAQEVSLKQTEQILKRLSQLEKQFKATQREKERIAKILDKTQALLVREKRERVADQKKIRRLEDRIAELEAASGKANKDIVKLQDSSEASMSKTDTSGS